tara:strand:+ start:617 stop:826 length:210 start_codon:yes stop_codon:yes gene_type:complete
MKKSNQYSRIFDNELSSNINLETNKIKTTNVNILLNRVKLNKKKELMKKTIFISLLFSITSIVAILAII